MAIDQRDVSSKLRFMDDGALQQYAAMHKNDPYIFPLAFQESQNRQRLRMQQQAQAGAQPQPKVADQALAQMAPQQAQPMPEDVGIGALPAQNMQFGAEGGIMGYEGYDEGPSDFGQEPVLRMAEGGVARYDFGGVTYGDWAQGEARRRRAQLEAERERNMRAVASGQVYVPTDNPAEVFSDPRLLGPTPAEETVGYTPPKPAPVTKTNPANKTDAVRKDPGSDRATNSNAGSDAGSGAGTGSGGTSKGSGSLEALYKKMQPSETEFGAIDAKRTSVADALKNLGKSGLAEFEAEEAKRGDVFKGREARLAEQGKRLEGREDKNLGMAFVLAGAKMMQTPGSLGKALGAGIETGSAQYVAGLDKLNAAQDRLMDAKDRLEELRINRDDLTSSERRRLKNQSKQYELEAEKLFLDGAEKKFGYKREDAKNMFAGITTLMGQETAAGATVQAAKIRSQDQKDYLAELRGGSLVEQTRKGILDNIIKANPYADEATRQRLYQTEWAKALQSNPALAKYAGVASGGGGGPANFVFNEKTGQLEPAR